MIKNRFYSIIKQKTEFLLKNNNFDDFNFNDDFHSILNERRQPLEASQNTSFSLVNQKQVNLEIINSANIQINAVNNNKILFENFVQDKSLSNVITEEVTLKLLENFKNCFADQYKSFQNSDLFRCIKFCILNRTNIDVSLLTKLAMLLDNFYY